MFIGSKSSKDEQPRVPVEAPEGVIYNDDTSEGFLSKDFVEVFDLIGEGLIGGLVTGEYSFSGEVGNIGWTKADPKIYDFAPDTDIRWLRSVHWNDVPIVDSDNKFNFQQIAVTFTPGSPNGALLGSESNNLITTRPIGERLRGAPEGDSVDDPANADYAKTYRILNKNVSSIIVSIKVNQLLESIVEGETAGDINRSEVNYSIYYRPNFTDSSKNGDWILGKAERIVGAIYQNGYVRPSTIEFIQDYSFDYDFIGYDVRIVRSTPDSTTTRIKNTTFIESISEVYKEVFRYPNSAIVRSKFDAEFFSKIPSRKFDTNLLKIKIPNNYNPIARTYGRSSGAPAGTDDYWDGTFKTEKEWSNNPAWCFYDLVTNRRYGLGKLIDESLVNKWVLYKIARYCDELVSDGHGKLEPRFECNIIFNGQEEAIKVLNDLASVFRAMIYYSAGGIFLAQDAPADSKFLFTNANVVNGEFKYQSSALKVRNTVAIVRFNDKTNFFKPAFEVVEDTEAIKRYGLREIQLSALGTTSRGQARRLGKWAILSESLLTESVEFTAGLEGEYLRPGNVVSINDRYRAGRRLSGRTRKVDNTVSYGAQVTLDSEIDLFDGNIYNLKLLTPTYQFDHDSDSFTNSDLIDEVFDNSAIQSIQFTGQTQSSVITGDNGAVTQILFDDHFNDNEFELLNNSVFSIDFVDGINLSGVTDEVSGQTEDFRVITIGEKDNKYNVVGVEYREDIYDAIETGLSFSYQGVGDTSTSPTDIVPASPQGLALEVKNVSENSKKINYAFSTITDDYVKNFYVYVRKGAQITDADLNTETYLSDILPLNTKASTYSPSENGTYYFRVKSKSINGASSINTADNSIYVNGVNPLLDINISSLRTSKADSELNDAGTESFETIKEASPTFLWNIGVNDGAIFPSDINYRMTARKRSGNSVPNGVIYKEITGFSPGVDGRQYNFDIDANAALEGGPFREYDFVVEAHDGEGLSSAGGNFLTDINSSGNRDSLFTDSQGYDIVHVNNPKVTGFFLSEVFTAQDTALTSGLTHTDQWIDAGGNLNIDIITGDLPTDIEGGFMYFKDEEFTSDEALFFAANGISRFPFSLINGQSLLQSAGALSNESTETGWLAASFYDTFDLAIDPASQPLDINNVVSVSKRGLYSDSELRLIIDLFSGQFGDHSGDARGFWERFETWSGDIETDITNLESDVSTLQSDMTTAESDITTLQSNVGSNDTELADHETRISTLEGLHP
tara:strand:- start:5106 stop:8837 length:3732 start_codon:yes stop_codon:yes gene_type:complete